jgi:hypothetical protein
MSAISQSINKVNQDFRWTESLPPGLRGSEVIKSSKQLISNNFLYVKSSGGKQWKYKLCDVRKGNQFSDFVLSDERGQIVVFSLDKNIYHTAKSASNPVSSLCFVESRKQDLVVAYENRTQVVIDYENP